MMFARHPSANSAHVEEPGSIAQLEVRLADPRLQVRFPARPHNFCGDWLWNNFYDHSLHPPIKESQFLMSGESIGTSTQYG